MTKKNKNKKKKEGVFSDLKEETKHSIFGIITLAIALFLTLSSLGKAGMIGSSTHNGLQFLFGAGFFLIPVSLFLMSISFFLSYRPRFLSSTLISGTLFLLSSLGMLDIVSKNGAGGVLGKLISSPLIKLFDAWVTGILFSAILIISILMIFNLKIHFSWLQFLKSKIQKSADTDDSSTEKENKKYVDEEEYDEEEEYDDEDDEKEDKKESSLKKAVVTIKEKIKPKHNQPAGESEEFDIKTSHIAKNINFKAPPVSLLEGDKGKPAVGDTKANSNLIKRTLQNFGIEVEMGEISIGPSITRYTLKPAEGIKLSRIVGLQNDLSLALAAYPLRIEAPIPGKSLVGIELPNNTRARVGLANLIQEEEFQTSPKSLLVTLGRGVSGKSYFSDIAKMPHLLIAGATGAGKSVMIHTLITSLLYRNAPRNLRFIMIDPKRVELTLYNKIPHLLTPVITDAKKAILALKWAAREMERRYNILEEHSVRDISSYHKNILTPSLENDVENRLEDLPHIIIVLDELADIMSAYPRELESAIVRLAQMSRAVGIHLIVSTQRPSVEVITGLIKANIPSRIALQVASQIDSRTIIDMAGAEKLLGSGDMLYLASDMAKPTRIQSPFISENEVKKVVSFIVKSVEENGNDELEAVGSEEDLSLLNNGQNTIFPAEDGSTPGWNDEEEDELYEEARETVIAAGKASSSYLQRKLKVGYSRAARLIDILEERGVVGPADGSKPREVLMNKHEEEGEFPE